jgi:hypothetical protein
VKEELARSKTKGKARATTLEAGPSRPTKRPWVYEVEMPTDLESDEMAAAVMEAGGAFKDMGKRMRGFGAAMEKFGVAMRRIGEALDKHDL